MQNEKLTFTFVVIVPPTSPAGTAYIKLNGAVVATQSISIGRQTVSALVSLDLRAEYDIELELESIKGARIENVMLTWNESNESYDPYWMDRDTSPNVVWDYKNKEAGEIYRASQQGTGVRTIPLDYETDGHPSFLRNYAKVTVGGVTSDIRNEKGPYTFKGPGSMSIRVRAPLSYWLLERLFTAL